MPRIQSELVAFLAEQLSGTRPDIEVTSTRSPLGPTIMMMDVHITAQASSPGAKGLPCCLAATNVTLLHEHDVSDSLVGQWVSLGVVPFLAGPDSDRTTADAVAILQAQLNGPLYWLSAAQPPPERP